MTDQRLKHLEEVIKDYEKCCLVCLALILFRVTYSFVVEGIKGIWEEL
jgi:hypothetical protein